MENKKTVAERLRNIAAKNNGCMPIADLAGGRCYDFSCTECANKALNNIADMIEAEQAELRERVDELNSTFIDLASLDLLCEKLDMSPDLRGIAEQIRAATKPMKRHHEVDVDVLPDGIEWPRFEDGELVKFGDEVYIPECDKTGKVDKVHLYGEEFVIQVTTGDDWFCSPYESYGTPVKRPEPEVLDADGVPIKVGDTVWYGGKELVVKSIHANEYCAEGEEPEHLIWCGEYIKEDYPLHHIANQLTHRKPDTFESVAAEMLAEIEGNDNGPEIDGYLARFRKLLGGE